MTDNRIRISSYDSGDGLRAVVYNNLNSGYEIDFFINNDYILSESYTDKNLYYHENAAENFILGIKKI